MLALALAALLALASSPLAASETAWEALRAGGAVALVRHARAPGVGDPLGFRLEDCATQRNLSEAGRAQARALGQRFAGERVAVAAVRSSRWCRALDTARLAFPDVPVEPDPALDSIFVERANAPEQTAALRTLVAGWRGRAGTLVLVTHQVNVTALTGLGIAEGEVIVLRDGAVVGRIAP